MLSIKNKLKELVDSEGNPIGGDRNVVSDKEIETGPVDKPWNDDSDYEKGVPTTTDRATRYRQNIPWFAVYSYRSSTGRGMPINEKEKTPIPHDSEDDKSDVHPTGSSDWRKIKTKKQLEEEIMEDLVKKSKKDRDVFDKDYDTKTERIIDAISDNDLNDNQLERIKKAVLDKITKKDG